MFFSKLFKDKKGDKKNILAGIFNIAVVLNIVCLSISFLLLLACFFINKSKIDNIICAAIIVIAGCYVVEVFLAWASAILNDNSNEITEKKKKK